MESRVGGICFSIVTCYTLNKKSGSIEPRLVPALHDPIEENGPILVLDVGCRLLQDRLALKLPPEERKLHYALAVIEATRQLYEYAKLMQKDRAEAMQYAANASTRMEAIWEKEEEEAKAESLAKGRELLKEHLPAKA